MAPIRGEGVDERRKAARSPALDAIRAAACALVITFHLHTVAGVDFGPLNPLIKGGDTGVYVFFVLSGYLLYRPFIGRRVDFASYVVRRAARILPGYFVALGGLVLVTGNPLPAAHPIPYLAIASSYDLSLRAFLGSAWTLSAEVLFYVALPLIALPAARRPWLALAVVGVASATGSVLVALNASLDNAWLLSSFPCVLYAFVPGMALAQLERTEPAIFARLSSWPWLVLAVIYLIVGMLTSGLPVAAGPILGAALLIGWSLHRAVPGARALAFLGGMSYAAYLWHKDLIVAFGPIGAVLALVVAAASWAIVERPILARAHRFRPGFRPLHSPNPTASAAGD
jgi:peptidoglycan/LPS O-acetylase OafA/YrhL